MFYFVLGRVFAQRENGSWLFGPFAPYFWLTINLQKLFFYQGSSPMVNVVGFSLFVEVISLYCLVLFKT